MRFLPYAAAAVCLLSFGCGGNSPITFPGNSNVVSACDATVPNAQTNTQFAVQPAQTTLSLYPGQTATVDVAVQSLDGAPHQVQLSAGHLPTGLTVQPIQATTGGKATMTFQATNRLAFNCFTGAYVFNATVPISIVATSSSTTAATPMDLNVVLENPDFSPAKTDLPVLQLTTTDDVEVTSKDDYIDGTVKLTDTSNSANNFKGTMQIKGHGNSTWGMPKKPYNLKLDSKEAFLGMASSKKWILLANYDDKTMLRNALAFHLSQMFQMAWTPNSRFVELYMNGAYEGVYQVSEKVEIDTNRLNITEIGDDDDSGEPLTGGYLLEVDTAEDATFVFHTPIYNVPIDSDDPDPPTPDQQKYITSIVGDAETALAGSNFKDPQTGWRAHFDQNSLVDWFLVQELIGNQDGNFWSSDYFYKQRGDPLLYMGPAWDFDISSGNVNYSTGSAVNPSLPWIRTQTVWYARLFQDPSFLAAVKARWTEVRPQVSDIPAFIDSSASSLALGQQNNFQRWITLNYKVWPNPAAEGSYSGEIAYLKNWMASRVQYMDANYLQ